MSSRLPSINAIPSPSVQSAEKRLSTYPDKKCLELFLFEKTEGKGLSIVEKAVIEMQYRFGLRIQEVLNISAYDVYRDGLVLIKSEKGSNNRMVQPVTFVSFWTGNGRLQLPLSDIYSQKYFYRLYRKLGFYQKFKGNKRDSVTHYFRHVLIERLQSEGMSLEDIQLFTGHASKRGLDHYVL